MSKLLAVLVIVAMVGGCCTYTAPDGTSTESFSNCFKVVQDWICNAPAAVVAIADAAITLLKNVGEAYIPGTKAYTAMVTAQNIKATGCAALAGINDLIAFLQSDEAQQLQAKAMLKARPMRATAFNITPLIAWRDSVR